MSILNYTGPWAACPHCGAGNSLQVLGYAEALLIGTPKDQLVESDKPKVKTTLSPEEVARMEHEMEMLERDFKAVETSYGENMLNLTLARGYVKKLLENARVVRFLNSHHSEVFREFETIASFETIWHPASRCSPGSRHRS